MRSMRGFVIAAAVGTLAAGIVGSVPASAGTAERGHYVDTYDDVFDACGTPVEISGAQTGHFVGQLRGSNPVAFYVDHFADRTTYLNLDTQRSYTTVRRITHRDTSYEQVSATVIHFTSKESGTFSVYDGAGKLYYRQAGLEIFDVTIDTMGTDDESDDVVLAFSYSNAGHFGPSDFCADVAALTS